MNIYAVHLGARKRGEVVRPCLDRCNSVLQYARSFVSGVVLHVPVRSISRSLNQSQHGTRLLVLIDGADQPRTGPRCRQERNVRQQEAIFSDNTNK